MRESRSMGCYVSTPCCTLCDWFKQPTYYLEPPRLVCPDCGGDIKIMVGRYEITVVKRFMRGSKTYYTAFERKNNQKSKEELHDR